MRYRQSPTLSAQLADVLREAITATRHRQPGLCPPGLVGELSRDRLALRHDLPHRARPLDPRPEIVVTSCSAQSRVPALTWNGRD